MFILCLALLHYSHEQTTGKNSTFPRFFHVFLVFRLLVTLRRTPNLREVAFSPSASFTYFSWKDVGGPHTSVKDCPIAMQSQLRGGPYTEGTEGRRTETALQKNCCVRRLTRRVIRWTKDRQLDGYHGNRQRPCGEVQMPTSMDVTHTHTHTHTRSYTQ